MGKKVVSSRRKIVKTTADQEFEKAKKTIKKMSYIASGFIALIAVICMIVGVNTSYAYVITNKTLPASFTSNVAAEKIEKIAGIAIPADFTGTSSSGDLTNIYAWKRTSPITSGVTYNQGAKTVDGIAYILDYASFNTGNASLERYLTQITIWWYLDRFHGCEDSLNYVKTSDNAKEIWEKEETTDEDKYDESGNYRFYNNLSVLEKQAIAADADYGQEIINFVTKAMNQTLPTGNPNLKITKGSDVSYQVTADGYLETSEIAITSDYSNEFELTFSTSDNVEIVNLDGKLMSVSGSGGALYTGPVRFKLRSKVPAMEIENNQLSIQVKASATFRKRNAYTYVSDNNTSEVILGVANTEDLNDTSDISFTIEIGKVTIHNQHAETGKQISGATLVITNDKGVQVAKFISGEQAETLSLPVGNYTVTETIFAEGYSSEQESYNFTITKDGQAEVIIKNVAAISIPNTSTFSKPLIYGIGAGIIIVGIILIVVAIKPDNHKKRK